MTQLDRADVTRLLDALREGDRAAMNSLFPLVYDELHSLARRQRRHWQGDYTLNTTALVHEAYLKLVDQDRAEWTSRIHFMAVAARAMRHILSNYARSRRAEKRGGNVPKVSLEDVQPDEDLVTLTADQAETLVALEEALRRLERISERQSRIVECRFFGKMSIDETAAALFLSPATVKRGWAMAQAWLHREMMEALHE